MAKFKINSQVIVNETGESGVVMCREIVNDSNAKRTDVQYYVKLGEGVNNYKWFKRSELSRKPATKKENGKIYHKVYDMPNGYKLTVVSIVSVSDTPRFEKVYRKPNNYSFLRPKEFRLGYSLCSPMDKFDENYGYKLAHHRAVHLPFCYLTASFKGEFNEITSYSIMDGKAKYIADNIELFIK